MSAATPDDTIAAIATATGGGVGIIRLSGPRALAIARAHFRGLTDATPHRHLAHGWWHDADDTPLDEGLAVTFAGPRSFTGEDVAELHLHGGVRSLRRCLQVAYDAGARPAEPGEFTRRAFLNGRIDLTRAEAIADLVAAQTDRALAQARSHLQGRLHDTAMAARERILRLRAMLEVNIDFVDEDVPIHAPADLARDARAVATELADLAATWQRGHLLRDGARVVLAGRPNAGKSSLFNALLDDERAIVTAIPGTTRDTVDATVDIHGVPVTLVDTAGVRDTADEVEAHGVARSRRQIAAADLVLHLVAPGDDPADDALAPTNGGAAPALLVRTKADLYDPAPGGIPGLSVSAVTRAGLDALRAAIADALGAASTGGGELVISRERHRQALDRAALALTTAADALDDDLPAELACVDVQDATDALAELVGLTTIEDVLDRLFATFCIGK